MDESEIQATQEAKLAAVWRNGPAEWTEACIDPETISALVDRGRLLNGSQALFDHISGCDYCLRQYSDEQDAIKLARQTQRRPGWNRISRFFTGPAIGWSARGALVGVAATLILMALLVRNTSNWASQSAMRSLRSEQEASKLRSEANRSQALLAEAQARESDLQIRLANLNRSLENERKALAVARSSNRQRNGTGSQAGDKRFANRTTTSPPNDRVAPVSTLPFDILRDLYRPRNVAGNAEDAIQLDMPRGEVVPSLRPIFVWRLERSRVAPEERRRIAKYLVRIVDPQDLNHPLEFSVPAAPESDQPVIGQPSADRPLKPDHVYRWNVYALPAGADAIDVQIASASTKEYTLFRTPTEAQIAQLGEQYKAIGALGPAESSLATSKVAASRRSLEAIRKFRLDPRAKP